MDDETSTTLELAPLAGVWRRLFAFCLDGLLLGALGSGVGLVAFDALVTLGDWGRAVGFAVALLYFGAMDSVLFAGRSVGKRLLAIKVVTASGQPLGVGPSTIRAAIFCVPYFLNGAPINTNANGMWLAYLVSFIVFGVGISIVYLLLFNKHTRQSLHDLAVGAYVVSSAVDAPRAPCKPLWRVHLGVVSVILTAAVAAPVLLERVAESQPFIGLLSVQRGLLQVPDVRQASVNMGVDKFSSSQRGTTTTHVLSSRILLSRRVADLDALANRCAQITLDRDPAADKQDLITVSIGYGYDIGIASAWSNHNYPYSPAQWRRRLAPST
jgi:uncharacterized RDD family membrane protein YckC